MSFYLGKGKPGDPDFEFKKFEGFQVSPNGKYWGSEPINDDGIFVSELEGMSRKERRAYIRKYKLKTSYGNTTTKK